MTVVSGKGTSYKECDILADFLKMASEIKTPEILQVGAKQATPGVSDLYAGYFPNAKGYYGTDYQDGEDVDFVADLHEFSRAVKRQNKIPKKFDIIISLAVMEHVLDPFLAARELSACMNPGGLMYTKVPNCFPIHEFPYDYYRFTIEGLNYLTEQAGLETIDAAYMSPTDIISKDDPDVTRFHSYLFVANIARKPEKKPIIKRLFSGFKKHTPQGILPEK